MVQDDISQTVLVGILFVVLGFITWLTARPFLFPSLGPSAYLLAAGEGTDEAASAPYHVIGGHVIAVVAGFIAFHALAPSTTITAVLQTSQPVSSFVLLRFAASSVVSMTLTTFGMLVTDTNHPAACATTLIVSLGVLSSPLDCAYIVLAVIVLVVLNNYIFYPVLEKFDMVPTGLR